jgi:hypothetical protein
MKTLIALIAAICIISISECRAQDENWEKITSIKGGSVKRIAIDSKGTIYALAEIAEDKYSDDWVPGRLYSTIDNGANWSVVASAPDLVDFVIANGTVAGLGYRDGSIHFMSIENGVWTTQALGQNYPYTKIYHDGISTFMFTSYITNGFYGFYSTVSKEFKAFEGTYLDSFIVSNGYMYAINKTANAIVRTPIQSQLASYAPANWEVILQNSNQSPIYSITVSGDRIYTTYYGDFFTRLKMAYALQSSPKNWIDITMPFGLEIFNTSNIYDVKLNTSPTGKIFLSFWGAETSQKISGKLYVLNPVMLQWDKSKKYPGETIAVPGLTGGFVWKNEQEIYSGTDGIGVIRTTDGGGVWSLRNGAANNTINDITTGHFVKVGTGRILFIHTKRARGYYYSDDQGETWTFYTPFINGEPITFKSFMELRNSALLAQTTSESFNSSILYSSDGLNWSSKNSSITSNILTEINGKIVSIYYGLSGLTTQYSNDLGSTWSTQTINGIEGYSLSNQTAVLEDYIFIAANKNSINSILRINTSVIPWTATPVLSLGTTQSLSALFTLGDKLYIGDYNSIYVSDNLGESFTSSAFPHNRLIAVPEKTGGVALIKDNTCTVTQDDGQSFTNISTPYGEISEFFRANNGDLFASGVFGPVLKSKNSVIKESTALPDKITSEWIPLKSPFTSEFYLTTQFSLIKNNLIFSSEVIGYANSTDGGLTWSTRPGLTKVFSLGDELIGYEYNTPTRSTDNGVTWTFLSDQVLNNYHYSMSKLSVNEYLTVYRNSNLVTQLGYSTDLKSWTTIQNNYSASLNQTKELIFFNGYLFLSMYGNDNLLIGRWTSAATGVNFSPIQGLGKIDKILVSDGKLILFASTGTIYTSSNGEDWTAKPCPPGNELYVTDLNYYFIMTGGTSGYLSSDSGTTWQKMDYNLLSKPFNVALDKNSGYGYLALPNNFVYKSSSILVQNNRQNPEVKEFFPAIRAANVPPAYSIKLNFTESVTPVAGKSIKIYEQNNLSTPVEVIQATDGIRQDYTYIYTPTLANASSKTYVVLIDQGAFIDLYNDTYNGINNIFQWSYSMKDVTPPEITHTPVNLSKGTLARFQVDVNDNNTLPIDRTKIFFRGITKKSTDSFSQTALLVTNGAGTNTIKQEISLPETAYDGMGIEYYFEAEDANGNKRRSPTQPNTFYYSYIEYAAPNQPKINQALSFGGELANYRIVSFPYKFRDSTTQTVLKSLQPYETTRWRLYGYTGGENFDENPAQLNRGRGYWMNVKNSTDVTLEGASNPINNKNSFYTIKLIPGWNLIGNPYPTTISWNEVKAGNTSVGSVKVFEGNAFSNGNDLLPHQGGFVFVTGDANVNLKVRFKEITTGGRIGESSEPITTDSWTLPLHVTSANFKNKLGGIGMKPDALEGQDNYDDYNPPVFMNFCQLESTDKSATGFAKNIVSTSDEYSWSFVVKTNFTDDITLSWDDNILSKLGKDFYLLDLSTQVLINMRERNSYQFSGTSQNAFKIFYGNQLSEKLKPTLATLNVSPNPATDFVNVYYTIPDEISASAVKIEIVDLTGRVVQVLENKITATGFFLVKINTEALEQNMYVVRMVTDSPGATKSITKKLIIRR